MRTAYLICPVRGASAEEVSEMYDYVERLEMKSKIRFHFPHRDVDQRNDDGAVRIAYKHMRAMMWTDEVHVWLTRSTKDLTIGGHFDFGMAFMANEFRKSKLYNPNPIRWVIANPPLIETTEKHFSNLLRKLINNE
jgi:hypothetical protein